MSTTEQGYVTSPPTPGEARKQEPFSRVAPMLKTALLMGACGGFVLATVLTLARAFSVQLGAWWEATAQAHGHLQLYGWAGLFVLGVALHFLPRLRGAPLIGADLSTGCSPDCRCRPLDCSQARCSLSRCPRLLYWLLGSSVQK